MFRRVTLPAIRPGLVAGAVLAWARALGEFGATITFAGNFPGRTQTMPLAIYLANEIDPDEAIVLSLVLIAVSFGVLVALRDRFLGGGTGAPPAMSLDARDRPARSARSASTSTLDAEARRDRRRPRPERLGQEHAVPLPGRAAAHRRRAHRARRRTRSTTRPPSIFVRPERRPVAVVFQDYLLFPNLTALENVAFGLRARGVAKAEARRRRDAWLERVGLADHAQHRPRALSGGQAQRVALARALATEPRLLLLDEPLAALDAGTRGDVRRDLRRHLATFDGVRLLVTHDPVDAYALADRVVILEAGRRRPGRHARRRHRPTRAPATSPTSSASTSSPAPATTARITTTDRRPHRPRRSRRRTPRSP